MATASPRVLYRDCLRLIRHTAGTDSPKSLKLKEVVKSEFLKNANVKDAHELEKLRGNAIRALTNYMLLVQHGSPGGGNVAKKPR